MDVPQEIPLNEEEVKWIDSMIERYYAIKSNHITRSQVLKRVLYHGFAKAEQEMVAIEKGFDSEIPPKETKEEHNKGKKFGHLTLID